MNWKWVKFSPDAQRIMMERSILTLQAEDAVGLSSLLKAFHQMEFNWTETESVKEAVFAATVKHFGKNKATTNPQSGREIANVIYSLGKSGIQWEDLSKDVQDCLFHGISEYHGSFNEQGISNVIHG
jgi:hypothetical protein